MALRSDLHVRDAQLLVLLLRALVDLYFDLRVVCRRMRVVNEAIGERVVEDESERGVTFRQLLDPVNMGAERSAVGTVASKWVDLLQLVGNFGEHALDCRVDAAESARLQLEVDLGEADHARVALEHVPVDVLRALDVEGDFGGFLGNATALLDFRAFVPASLAAERHDDDLFEEGDSGTAHLDHSRVEAGGAG